MHLCIISPMFFWPKDDYFLLTWQLQHFLLQGPHLHNSSWNKLYLCPLALHILSIHIWYFVNKDFSPKLHLQASILCRLMLTILCTCKAIAENCFSTLFSFFFVFPSVKHSQWPNYTCCNFWLPYMLWA